MDAVMASPDVPGSAVAILSDLQQDGFTVELSDDDRLTIAISVMPQATSCRTGKCSTGTFATGTSCFAPE